MECVSQNIHRIEGKVNIPEDKKEEFNRNVFKILKMCGIRKIVEMEISGQNVTVVRMPKADEEGIVSFDYSIFEQWKNQEATYNIYTNELDLPYCDYSKFGFAMYLIMIMQEAYSEGHCYFMEGNEICDVEIYAKLLENEMDINLSFHQREDVWEMLLYFKTLGTYENITADKVLNSLPNGYAKWKKEQSWAVICADYKDGIKAIGRFEGEKADIEKAEEGKREYFAVQIFQSMLETDSREEVQEYLKELLDADLETRKVMAERDDQYGLIAEISLYVLPACVVAAYSWAGNEDFWKVWFSLGIQGYKEIITEKKEEAPKEKKQITGKSKLYVVLSRDNADKFLEFGDEQKLVLSERMKLTISEWKDRYWKIFDEEVEDLDVESEIVWIIEMLDKVWHCRYLDKEFVDEFLQHKYDKRYKKAVLLYRLIVDESFDYFPELTRKQASAWILNYFVMEEDRVRISAYQSLMINYEYRARLFGF